MLIPKSFRTHDFSLRFQVNAPLRDIYPWLMSLNTFTKGQIPPYKVEFLQESPSPYMQKGDKTNHHGPLIQFAGEITAVDPFKYRRLDYYYGSYALSFRLARPRCLEIFTSESDGQKTNIELKLKTDTHKYFYSAWNALMLFFWTQFKWNVRLLWLFKQKSSSQR